MTEYTRKDRNGNELKIGDKVNVYSKGVLIGGGNMVQCPYKCSWAQSPDVVWVEWTWGEASYVSNIGESVVSNARYTQKAPKPHPHAELIKMWADDPSIKIQYFCTVLGRWLTTGTPDWVIGNEYRIKPKEKKFVSKYKFSWLNSNGTICNSGEFQTKEEAEEVFNKYNITNWTCLEWTKKEFEVED